MSEYNNLFKYEENKKEDIIFIKKKNYFMIEEIKTELDKLKINETIFQRKEYVKNKLIKDNLKM